MFFRWICIVICRISIEKAYKKSNNLRDVRTKAQNKISKYVKWASDGFNSFRLSWEESRLPEEDKAVLPIRLREYLTPETVLDGVRNRRVAEALPGVFVALTTAQLLFMYVVLKIGHYPLIRQQQAILSDLESQVTTETDRVEALKRTWRRWAVLLAVLGTVLLLLGILRAVGWPG